MIVLTKSDEQKITLFSIRIDPNDIDRYAEENDIKGPLTHIESNLSIKTPFKKAFEQSFNMFDSRERIESIYGILSKELDFSNLVKQGIILEHYPLHKRRTRDISDEFNKSKWKLILGLLTGNFMDHFTSINFIKSYYGEKYAFEFIFLLHYQAWLIYPSIFGIIIFVWQMVHTVKNNENSLDNSQDGTLNGIFGIFLTIWSSFFIESWKHKEKIIRHHWCIEQGDLQSSDERKEEFVFKNVYDDLSFNKVKQRVEPDKKKIYRREAINLFCLAISIGLMTGHIYFNGKFTAELKSENELLDREKQERYILLNKIGYSVLIILLSTFYRTSCRVITDLKNWQF